jgi:glycosyltransferase involved in cell wall biosynthesis
MRVIHLNYSDINGGAARAAYRIHHSLLKEGVNSKMWVNEKNSDDLTIKPTGKFEKITNLLRIGLTRYTIVKLLKSKNQSLHSPSVLPSKWVNLINNSNANLVHLHWIQNETLSIKDISKIKKPILWTLYDMWAFCGAEHYTNDYRWINGYNSNNRQEYEYGFDLNRWTWNRKKKYWKNPIRVVTPSKWLTKCVGESLLMKNWPVSTIHLPIDVNFWKPLDKQVALDQLHLPKNVPLVLFGALRGGEDPRKGFDLLLAALKHLKVNNKIKKIELVVFGQSKPKIQLDLGYPVHYLGHLNDDFTLRSLYSAVDVVIVPSRQEVFGQTALEAQACGAPVVSFDVGGLPDIIEHQVSGYLAKAFNIEDLARGIIWILEQKDKKKIRNYASKLSHKKFSEKKIANDYLNIYKKLIK